MDEYTLAHIRLTNLLTKAVELHDSIAHAMDRLHEEHSTGKVDTVLKNAGPIFKELRTLYTEEVRDAAIVLEYLAGHDLFSISNDFKLSRKTVKAVLERNGVDLSKPIVENAP